MIAEYLAFNEKASIKELLTEFGVSINTLRSDLSALEAEGILKKTYGGVQYVRKMYSLNIRERALENARIKKLLSKRAAEQVEDGDVIYIDFGTTTLYIPQYLEQRRDVTIITANLNVVMEAMPYPNLKLIILPGQISRKEQAVMSENAVSDLENYNIDKAFMANAGITRDGRLSVVSYVQREIKKVAMKQSQKHFLVTESSKFSFSDIMHYSVLQDMDMVITDSAISKESQMLIEGLDVKAEYVDIG